MALQPSTSVQVAENSILDLNGKQSYLGNSFILPQNSIAITTENETPIILIVNPSSNTKSLFIFTKKFYGDNNACAIRTYYNPTVTSTGSATPAVNTRTGSTTTSVAKCYLGASVSSNGTFVSTLLSTEFTQNTSAIVQIIDPGTSFFLTAQQSASGTTSLFGEISWYEL
jgi:hypothetical protein